MESYFLQHLVATPEVLAKRLPIFEVRFSGEGFSVQELVPASGERTASH